MNIVTVGEWQKGVSKYCKKHGDRFLVVNTKKREIVGQILVEEPPKEFRVERKYVHNYTS